MFSTSFSLVAATVLASAGCASAHMAAWDFSMYGINGTDDDPVNTSQPGVPLDGATFDQWWFHGYMDFPPPDGVFLDIPNGGTLMLDIARNKAFTHLNPLGEPESDCPLGSDFCHDWSVEGNASYWDVIHTMGHQDLKGCAFAMAYESDPHAIEPEDFTVVSVQPECVWKRHTPFQMPDQLQECPEGGCHCVWSWIHSYPGGTAQTTHTFFRCNVSNAASPGKPLAKGLPAVQCDGSDAAQGNTKCLSGAKQLHYWLMAERNNQFQESPNPPVYLPTFGFQPGAQSDAFDEPSMPRGTITVNPPWPANQNSTAAS